MRSGRVTTLIAVVMLFCAVSETLALQYQITDYGVILDGNFSISGINRQGQVVGTAALSGENQNAFIWDRVNGVRDLGTLPTHTRSSAFGINDAGQAVGYSSYAWSDHQACVWESNGDKRSLGTLPSGDFSPWSEAYDINNFGQIVGYSTGTNGYYQAVIWDKDSPIESLGTLDGVLDSVACAINDSGIVVGESGGHAFFWNRQEGMQDLGQVGIISTRAEDINNLGQIVGGSYSGSGLDRAFIWEEASGMRELGTLSVEGYSYSYANAINNSGLVVGVSSDRAFVWDALGGIQELESLPGCRQSNALDVNDLGQIVGISYDQSWNAHLVLWEPVPEPSSLAALTIGLAPLVVMGLGRRRPAK